MENRYSFTSLQVIATGITTITTIITG